MSILRAALVGSCAIPPCCRPISTTHLCRKAVSHPLWSTANNAAPPRAQRHLHIWDSSLRFPGSSSSSGWRFHGWETTPPSPFWTRVVSPVASFIECSDSRGKGCDCRVRGRDIRKGAGENSSFSSLLNFSDHRQQRPYATRARNCQSATAGAGWFSAMWERRLSSRGDGGEAESGSKRTSSVNRAGRAFAEEEHPGSGGGGVPLTDLEKDKFKEVDIKRTNKLLTLPTVLTLARVAAVPAILAVFYSKEPWATSAGAVIFVLAAVTDWLDGYLARKMGTSSAFGAFLDPVADKLMVAAALVLLCTKPLADADLAAIPWLLPIPTIAIIGREITMSAVREWAAAQGGDLHKAVAVNNLGKVKTAAQMVSITLLLASGEGGLDSRIAGVVGVGLLYVAAILALWSLAKYMRGISGSMFR